jgi:hypothetical protein
MKNFEFRTSNFEFALAALVLVFVLLEGTAWAQCAMCRTALESSAEGQAIAGGFRKGIVLLLAAPYAIFGTIAYFIVRAYQRKAT